MKALILATALPLLASLTAAQDPSTSPKEKPAETIKKAQPAAFLGIAMAQDDGSVTIGQVLPDSPAARGGLKPGDVILQVGDHDIDGQIQRVTGHVGKCKPGDTIEIKIRRGDREEVIKVELGERPDMEGFEDRGQLFRKKENGKKAGEEPRKGEQSEAHEEKKTAKEKVEKAKRKDAPERDDAMDEKALQKWLKQYSTKPNPRDPADMLREYMGRSWTGDALPRPGIKMPLLEWAKRHEPEAQMWKRVEESVGRALKESGLSPDVVGKAMQAVKEARTSGPEQQARRARLKAEAARLDKELQALREKADKVREELKKAEALE